MDKISSTLIGFPEFDDWRAWKIFKYYGHSREENIGKCFSKSIPDW